MKDAFKLTGLLWDIRNSGNYELRQCWSGDPADSYQTIWTGSAPGTSEVTITLPTPIVLTRGVHYLALVRTSGAATMYTKSGSFSGANFIFSNAYYNGSAGGSLAPVQLIGQPGAWA